MKVITVINRKGGVGKTTISRYVSEYFARYKKLRVLSIDMDNQCNLSQLLLKMDTHEGRVIPPIHPEYDPKDTDWNGRSSSASLIWDGSLVTYDVMYPKPIPGWEILPGDSKQLYDLEHEEDVRIKTQIRTLLGELLAGVETEYDLIVIDTGPSASALLSAALGAATHVLIPFAAEPQSVNGIGQLMSLVRQEGHSRRPGVKPIEIVGLAVNLYRPQLRAQTSIIEAIKGHPIYGPLLIPHTIKNRSIFPELDAKNPIPESVFDITKKEQMDIKTDMEEFCSYVDQKVFGGSQ